MATKVSESAMIIFHLGSNKINPVLSHLIATREKVWIRNWIYWTLTFITSWNFDSYITKHPVIRSWTYSIICIGMNRFSWNNIFFKKYSELASRYSRSVCIVRSWTQATQFGFFFASRYKNYAVYYSHVAFPETEHAILRVKTVCCHIAQAFQPLIEWAFRALCMLWSLRVSFES
jgi:hypothetical protein